MKCPFCNVEMEKKSIDYSVSIGYGKSTDVLYTFICPNCGYDEDDKNNRNIISKVINKSLNDCAISILSSFKEANKSFSEIERKFYLPYRTLSKWLNRSMKPSAAAVALLRIIKAFPWMEKIADLGIESSEAQSYVRNYYYTEFNDKYKQIMCVETEKKHIYVAFIDKEKSGLKPAENIYINNKIIKSPYTLAGGDIDEN